MPAASPTTSRRGLGLSERPVRRFSNPTSELGEPATPIVRAYELLHSTISQRGPQYQPSPQSEGGLRAIAKRHGEREFFQARDAINMSPTPSLPSSATLPRNNSSTSLVDYGPRNGDRSYRRVASFNAAPLDFDPLPSDVKTRRRTMHEIVRLHIDVVWYILTRVQFSTGRREQMDMALHYDVCDELSRTASSTPHVAANDSDLGSGMPDGHEEDTPLLSRPPSPPPSSPSQQSRDVNEQYEPDPAYYRARLESEIAMLSAHVGALTHQLFQVRAMCHDLYATRAPPMIPYCTVPHVSPGMPFFSTVRALVSFVRPTF